MFQRILLLARRGCIPKIVLTMSECGSNNTQ